jgi:pyruvate ferredoxin oxidoreductase alpha subunit
MTEVLYNIAGLRIPLVLTCANRAVSAPLSIWNDQQDSMAVRDAGWVQLYCATNQEAVDTTIQAYRIAEQCELPVMVCVDGFTLTHTLEVLDLPDQEQVDSFLPPFSFERRQSDQHRHAGGTGLFYRKSLQPPPGTERLAVRYRERGPGLGSGLRAPAGSTPPRQRS